MPDILELLNNAYPSNNGCSSVRLLWYVLIIVARTIYFGASENPEDSCCGVPVLALDIWREADTETVAHLVLVGGNQDIGAGILNPADPFVVYDAKKVLEIDRRGHEVPPPFDHLSRGHIARV
jgi:hypothetical protein